MKVPNSIFINWQETIDIMAEIFSVPVALLMRLVDTDIEVFVSSKSENNPYKKGNKESVWGSGLYCEEVIRTQNKLLIPNALEDAKWENNPDIKLNLISYLGFPINLPNGEPFGTICVLDSKENSYSELFERLMLKFKKIIENDIRTIFDKKDLEYNNLYLKESVRESKELFYKAFASAPVMITISKIEDGTYIEVNDTFVNCTGYTKDQAIGKTSIELGFIRKEDRAYLKRNIIETGHIRHVELNLLTQDGSAMTCLYSGEEIIVGGKKRLLSTAVDITDRKQKEDLLSAKQSELEAYSKKLEDMNTALNVLVDHKSQEKEAFKQEIITLFENLVFPYLSNSASNKNANSLPGTLSIIERNIKEILLKGSKRKFSLYMDLTPMESQIAQMIKEGKTSKDIANSLKMSVHTVYFHRDNIRKKLDLKKSKTNLKSYLQSHL